MINLERYRGAMVGVLGMGRSGLSVADALHAGGARVLCWDDGQKGRKAAEMAGHEVVDIANKDLTNLLDRIIVSPGIPHLYPAPHKAIATAMKLGVTVDNDIGLLMAHLAEQRQATGTAPVRLVCVTGSNGKSTTASLIHHILRDAGHNAELAGNIGKAVFDLPEMQQETTLVLELSSYQLELAQHLLSDVAVFLNLSDDHLERHGGRGGYFAAKKRLFEMSHPRAMVIGTDETEGRFLATMARDRLHRHKIMTLHGLEPDHFWGRQIFVRHGHLIDRVDQIEQHTLDLEPAKSLKGKHNHQNAAAAYATCHALGLTTEDIESGIHSFGGLAHRAEKIATLNGIDFINDSKATNADAAEKALLSFDRIHWIVGGQAKAGGIAPLKHLYHKVKRAYIIGETPDIFAQSLQDQVAFETSGTLQAAVTAAARHARPDDIILLSPAAASFDQFDSFEARGEAFRALVHQLQEDTP